MSDPMIDDLMRPQAHDPAPLAVELRTTHISWVLLAGERVFKLKKPLDFGFLNFTTLEKRFFFCQEEVRLNRRLAPDIYLGVVPVFFDPQKGYSFKGPGEVVDYAVEMKRLPEEGMMAEKLKNGEVTLETMDELARILVPFYREAATGDHVDEFGRIEVIRHNTDEDFWQMTPFVGTAISGSRFDHIKAYTDRFLEDRRELFERRVKQGRIREGHGDMHLGNICLGNKIWIFDCIEFNEYFRYQDVACDLAFLAMDLDFNGRTDLARRLIATYVNLSGDRDLPEILEFYKCYRACVRGKIHCFAFDQKSGEEQCRALDLAQKYFDLAHGYASGPRRPRIVVFFGLMGSGKTHWARATGTKMGAPVLSSDHVRKKLAGLASDTRMYVPFGEGLYRTEVTENVYRMIHNQARSLAASGLDVIVDASYMKDRHRRALLEAAAAAGAETAFVRFTAREEEIVRRLEARQARGRSMSDGRREIYGDQVKAFDPVNDLAPAKVFTIDNTGLKSETAARLWAVLGLEPDPGPNDKN